MSLRTYIYFLCASLVSLGDAILYITLPFLAAYSGDHRARNLAMIIGVGSAARLCAPLMGQAVDKFGSSRIAEMASIIRLITLVLAFAWVPSSLFLLVLLSAVNGLISAALTTAGGAALPEMVEEASLGRANALNAIALMGVPLIGYAVAGMIIASHGVRFAIAASLILGLPMLYGARLLGGQVQNSDRPGSVSRVRPRLRIWLLSLGICTAGINAIINVSNVRAPLHFIEIGSGAQGYGVFESVLGGGVILGLVVGAAFAKKHPQFLIILASSLIVAGVATILLWQGLGWYVFGALLGLGVGVGQVVSSVTVQDRSPKFQLGRNMGVLTGMGAAGLLFGSFLAGLSYSTEWVFLSCAIPVIGASVLFCAITARQSRPDDSKVLE